MKDNKKLSFKGLLLVTDTFANIIEQCTFQTKENYMTTNTCCKKYEFDFAFTFAGEDRGIVESLKENLIAKKYNVFYDNDNQSKLVGTDLYSYLRKLYREKCKFVVCFISENYQKKIWTNLELTAIKERLMSTFFASDFLIPIILDNSEMLNDIPTFIGFYKHVSIEETCNLLIEKYNNSLTEDNYINNISNCIDYIIMGVLPMLSRKNFDSVSFKKQSIVIIKNNIIYEYKLAHDDIADIPCILLYKSIGNQTDFKADLPSLFINWNRENRINFKVHSFESHKNNISLDLSMHDLIIFIENYIVRSIHGGAYHD